MRRSVLTLFHVTALMLGGLPARADEGPTVPAGTNVGVGDRVRLSTPGTGTLVGTLVSLGDRQLTLRLDDASDAANRDRTLRRDDLTRFDVSLGRHRNTRKGFFIGAAFGASLDVAFIVWVLTSDVRLDARHPARASTAAVASTVDDAAVLSLFFGTPIAVGGAIGAVVGATTQSDRWAPAPLRARNVSLAVAPTRDRGMRAMVSVTF